jgi:POT family proton-dependent oligopeptide transporter
VSKPTVLAERSRLRDHPIGIWFFFWGEFAERCSFYGMRAILFLYMTGKLGFEDDSASMVMSYFIAACYLLPLIGGYVADRYFGRYRTIIAFSLPYIVGQLIMGIEDRTYLFISLSLLAVGSGVIKPNISTLMGLTYDQQRPGMERLRSDGFALFYGSINIGAAISSFAMPWIRNNYSYQTAFFFPAVMMVLAFLLFALGKPFYAKETIHREPATPVDREQQWTVLERLLGLFVVVMFFWSIFDQSTTTWTMFARDHLDATIFSPDQLQAFNPVFIVLFLPLVTGLWHVLPRWGINLRPTDKMLIGFILTTITMAIIAVAGFRAVDGVKISVLWEVIPYMIITVAELCISVVGLELAFTAAPPPMKSFVSACWLLTVFFGNILNAQITPLYNRLELFGVKLSPGPYFTLLTILMVVVTIAFVLVAQRFNRGKE